MAAFFLANAVGQVVITDTGSTNRPGMTVTLGAKGKAEIAGRHGEKAEMELQADLQIRLMKHVEAAMPLDQMNAAHCAKSVSFGSRMYVTYKGVRSPDISCSGQTDPNTIALQKDAQEIMGMAKAKLPLISRSSQGIDR
jgi:hypothetical protein